MSIVTFKQHPFTRQWRWKIKASNGKCIASANEGFYNRKDCEHNLKITMEAIQNYLISNL
jgi:hypothetical protein